MPTATYPSTPHNRNIPNNISPTDTSMVAEPHTQSQWLFTEDELLLAPSIVEGGLSPEKERENRGKGVNFILQAGIMLKLPQITLATASVFLHRFYMRHSMVDIPGKGPGYHYYSMAATCLFLATKVEENCRKMQELVVACVRVAQKDLNKVVDSQDKEFWRWKDNILHSEDVLLEALCFDLSLEAPYKTLFELLLQFRVENNKQLRDSAWAVLNDSCLTMLCLLFPSRVIATSAFYVASKHAGVAFPDDDQGRPWWTSIAIDIGDVRRACNYMAEVYENARGKAGREGVVYEKTTDVNDTNDKTRILGSRAGSQEAMNEDSGKTEPSHSKRDRESDSESKSHGSNEPTSNGLGIHGASDESPRKKRKTDDELEKDRNSVDRAGSGTQQEPIPSDSQAYSQSSPSQNNTVGRTADTLRVKEPDRDDVSEEGEVEA